jgi:hypothetical protein
MLSSDTYELQPRLLDGERTLVIKPDYLEYDTTHDGRVIYIPFKNYFGRRSTYHAVYAELVEKIWEYYFIDIVNAALERYYQGETLTLGKVAINKNGVAVTGTGLSFTWPELALKEYVTYFSIYKPKQPEFHLWVRFDEWNSELMLSVLKTLKSESENAGATRNSP